jgi:hypothetical protein
VCEDSTNINGNGGNMSHCQCDELVAGSSNTVKLLNLTDSDGDHRADATVMVTIKVFTTDVKTTIASGANVTGAVDIPMPYVPGDREYRGIVPASAALVMGTKYLVLVSAGVDDPASRRFPLVKIAS